MVNAAHMKAVPGRKTDVKDAEWIAELLQHGFLQASFIPSREQRELTRYRKSLTEECSRELNRLQKVLEGANVKLASVVGDIQGKSAQRLLDKLAAGETLNRDEIQPLLYKTLQPKLDDITLSLESITTPLQRALLRQILAHIDEIPGIARRSAQVILAEIGLDMDRFPSFPQLSSENIPSVTATVNLTYGTAEVPSISDYTKICGFSRKSCVKADKRLSRKREQIKGLPGQDTVRHNRTYPPVFRDEGWYARAA